MAFQIKLIKSSTDVLPYLKEISGAADTHKEALGFLPFVAYEKAIEAEKLWVALDADEAYMGHLWWSSSRQSAKVVQLYAHREKSGVGSALIEELILHSELSGFGTLSARVAGDLLANRFWKKHGFDVIRVVEGGATTNRKINIRVRHFDSNNLFDSVSSKIQYSALELARKPRYLCDINVFKDIIDRRTEYDAVARLFSLSLTGHMHLLVTPEFTAELERTSYDKSKDMFLAFAQHLSSVPKSEITNEELASWRRDLIPNRDPKGKKAANDNSDHKHLIYASRSDVDGFVTRDTRLLEQASFIRDKFELAVLSPDEVVAKFGGYGESDSDILYTRDGVSIEPYGPSDLERLLFLSTSYKLQTQLGDRLKTLNESNMLKGYLVSRDGVDIGAIVWASGQRPGNVLDAWILVAGGAQIDTEIVDWLLELHQLDLPSGGVWRTDLFLFMSDDQFFEKLSDYGYRRLSSSIYTGMFCFSKISATKVARLGVEVTRLAEEIEDISGVSVRLDGLSAPALKNSGVFIESTVGRAELDHADFERVMSPLRLLTDSSKGLIVSIREPYAKSLCGIRDQQLDLFPNASALNKPVRVYFRKPGGISRYEPGQTIFFYVSQTKKEVTHMARLVDVKELNRKEVDFSLLAKGVLTESEVESCSDRKGFVQVLLFDALREVNSPVSFTVLKEKEIASDANIVQPEVLENEKLNLLLSLCGELPSCG